MKQKQLHGQTTQAAGNETETAIGQTTQAAGNETETYGQTTQAANNGNNTTNQTGNYSSVMDDQDLRETLMNENVKLRLEIGKLQNELSSMGSSFNTLQNDINSSQGLFLKKHRN